MKKAIIAGLAGALVLPAVATAGTDVKLWGEFRGSAAITENHDLNNSNDTELSWTNNNSRIGIASTLNEGPVQALVWLEYGFDHEEDNGTSFASRQVYAGFKGNTWELTYGKRQSAYAWAGERVDPFYDTIAGESSADGSYGFSRLTDSFDGDQLAYYGNYAGFAVNAAIFFEDDTGQDDTGLGIGIGYDKGPLNAELQILLAGDNSSIADLGNEATAFRLSGGYSTKNIQFGASIEAIDPDGSADAEILGNISAGFAAGNGKVAVSLGFVNQEAGAITTPETEGVGVAVGYWWNMMDNTDLHALVSVVSPEADSADEIIAVGVGVKHSFSADLK